MAEAKVTQELTLREECDLIVREAIRKVQPGEAVRRALCGAAFGKGRLLLVSVGKAAWEMAEAARLVLDGRIDSGIVITKHGHSRGELAPLRVLEAGHPVPDADSFAAAREVLALTENLKAEDTVLFLLSGGGSALFESPLVPPEEMQRVTEQLLASGADITEMNTVRKRLSAVKGGRFAEHCRPARIFSIVLSDIIGDPLDMIASGPAYPDSSTCQQAQEIAARYGLSLSEEARACLREETPKVLDNVTTHITGSVRELCAAAAESCRCLGYRPVLLTDRLSCEAREAGRFLSNVARTHAGEREAVAFIAGGETVVHLTGTGRGGRNQELALAACRDIAGLPNAAVFSVGSDGTDGPTDAAGGYSDGQTLDRLRQAGLSLEEVLQRNDAYSALQAVHGLIYTGPTGTNVNDVAVALVRPCPGQAFAMDRTGECRG